MPSSDLIIRPATSADAALLPQVERRAGENFRQWPGLEWIAEDEVTSETRHLEMIAGGLVLLSTQSDGQISGFASTEMLGNAMHLWQIAVEPDHQGQGIGSALIARCRTEAMARSAKALTLTTFRDVPWNGPWYRRLGFAILATSDLTPELRKILEQEAEAGLTDRCAMSLRL
ncbi:GNAT family N-acetyltransferase [Paracoccus caeni]|uniref:GNAT family N-acetyltransferase n=1 Tax=Paracoccus caeni TaxID=657651 RepID=A0A934VZ73_9RHOB|nr:GNAT family N-acetyltransferase [Paracoccus caeni]MBK4215535.1 GNAT family N-acetyltransferase [Paracoccus caeni]